MFSHTQLEEVAHLKHAELIANAAQAHQLASLRRKRASRLPTLFRWLGAQGHKWMARRRPVRVEGIAASRQPAC